MVHELRLDNDKHSQYFRINKQSFDHLLSLVAPSITKQDTRLRDFIEPRLEKLAVTLHHLAEGASHKSIAAHYRLGRSTVSEIKRKILTVHL